MILALPREIRDLVIDEVLFSSIAAPVSSNSSQDVRPGCVYIPKLPWRDVTLLCINKQLHNETLQRGAILTIPLVLDILIHEDRKMECTWLNAPWQRTWEKVNMDVIVRTQPLSSSLLETQDNNTSMQRYEERRIVIAIKIAVLTEVLKRSTESMRFQTQEEAYGRQQERLCSTVAQIHISVTTSRDFVLSLSDRFEETFLPHRSAGSSAIWTKLRVKQNLNSRAIMSHVGRVVWSCEGHVVRSWDFGDMETRVVKKLPPLVRGSVVEMREEVGWKQGEWEEEE
jgi:hypothetical protein